MWNHNLPCIEIYGSEGSLSVPDLNTFGGPVRVRRAGQEDWKEMPLTHSTAVGRGIGVKASGGIRTHEAAVEMLRAGASRIGASAGAALLG